MKKFLPTPTRSQENWILNGLFPGGFLVFVWFWMPLGEVFAFDTDEGIQIAKAQLFQRGLLFAPEVWSDHAYLPDMVLGLWLNLWGDSMVAARLLTALFGALALWCFLRLLRWDFGFYATAIAGVFLIISCNFCRLSGSVMQGIPALALGLLAIYFLCRTQLRGPGWWWVVPSAIAMVGALLWKFIMLFLLPVMGLFLLWVCRKPGTWTFSGETVRRNGLIFLGWLGIIGLSIGALEQWTAIANLDRALFFHLGEQTATAYGDSAWGEVLGFYLQDLDYGLLMVLGWGTLGFFPRKRFIALPQIWIALITPTLINHSPVWYHYYLLISLPLIWLAAGGVEFILGHWERMAWRWFLTNHHWERWGTLALTLCLLLTPAKLIVTQWQNQQWIHNSQSQFTQVAKIQEARTAATDDDYLLTDLPLYGFYTGMKIIPELAVFSQKRLLSGELSPERLNQWLGEYAPQQIFMARFSHLLVYLEEAIAKNYELIDSGDTWAHYRRRREP